jgi:hypothetical protein
MHPYIQEALVRDRIATMRGVPTRSTVGRHGSHRHHGSPALSRHRSLRGWVGLRLVDVGLRIAGPSVGSPAGSAG